jgi:uncharacterized membrane protein YccC
MKIGLTEAAALIGKAPSTITRAVKAGRLSATQDAQGRTVYDVAELERVYGPLKSPDVARNDAHAMQGNAAQLDAQRAHEAEKAALERLIGHLEASNRNLTAERDRLLGIIEEQTQQVRLLTDQRTREEKTAAAVVETSPMDPAAPPRRGVLAWLFGVRS